MRWQCTACQVEWSTTGKDHGLCFNGWAVGLDCVDHIKEVPSWENRQWQFNAARGPDYDRSELWRTLP